MPLQTFQQIFQGAAQLLIGDAATSYYNSAIVDAINNVAGYTADDTELTVDTVATLCPDIATETLIADPPVVNIICATRTGELMWAYSKDDTSPNTKINVIRGMGIHNSKYDKDTTQPNAALVDNDELQLLGKITFPTRAAMVVTAASTSVSVKKIQGTFQTKDSWTGVDKSYTAEGATYQLTCSLPRSTTPQTMYTLGFTRWTNGASPARDNYMRFEGPGSAGQELNGKVIIVVPNEILQNISDNKQTIDAVDYIDFRKCIIIFNAQLNPEWEKAYQEGNQIDLPATFNCAFSEVFQTPLVDGCYVDTCRVFETV